MGTVLGYLTTTTWVCAFQIIRAFITTPTSSGLTTLCQERHGDRLLRMPAKTYPCLENWIADAASRVLYPLSQWLAFAPGCENERPGGVTQVFSQWYPVAVRRLVVAIVVNAVNGESIFVSMGKRPGSEDVEFVPFSTDSDASAAVVPVVRGLRLVAA